MPLRAVIVEDEPLSRQYICALLKNVPAIEIIDTAATQQEAIEKIEHLRPDIVFLDLELHSGTGLDVLRKISFPLRVVFTTALDHHAIRIIRLSGMPFLHKPIDAEELETQINFFSFKENKLNTKPLSYLLETMNNNNIPLHMHITQEQEDEFIALKDVVMIQSLAGSCKITFTDRPALNTSCTLQDFEDKLGAFHFFRANATTLINLQYAALNNPVGDIIKMKEGGDVQLSPKKRQAYLNKIKLD